MLHLSSLADQLPILERIGSQHGYIIEFHEHHMHLLMMNRQLSMLYLVSINPKPENHVNDDEVSFNLGIVKKQATKNIKSVPYMSDQIN